jgi:hypothetical protein
VRALATVAEIPTSMRAYWQRSAQSKRDTLGKTMAILGKIQGVTVVFSGQRQSMKVHAITRYSMQDLGAGDENRTRVLSLGS